MTAKALNTVDLVHKHFHLKILARAIDRRHAYELLRRGVEVVERETFGSAEMGVEALKLLGVRSRRIEQPARSKSTMSKPCRR